MPSLRVPISPFYISSTSFPPSQKTLLPISLPDLPYKFIISSSFTSHHIFILLFLPSIFSLSVLPSYTQNSPITPIKLLDLPYQLFLSPFLISLCSYFSLLYFLDLFPFLAKETPPYFPPCSPSHARYSLTLPSHAPISPPSNLRQPHLPQPSSASPVRPSSPRLDNHNLFSLSTLPRPPLFPYPPCHTPSCSPSTLPPFLPASPPLQRCHSLLCTPLPPFYLVQPFLFLSRFFLLFFIYLFFSLTFSSCSFLRCFLFSTSFINYFLLPSFFPTSLFFFSLICLFFICFLLFLSSSLFLRPLLSSFSLLLLRFYCFLCIFLF